MTKLGIPNLDWGVREPFSQEIIFKLKLEEQLGIISDVETFKGKMSCIKTLKQVWGYFLKSRAWEMKLEPWARLDQGGLGAMLTFCILSSGQWKMINAFKEKNDIIKLTGLKGHTGCCWVGKRNREKANGSFQFHSQLRPQASLFPRGFIGVNTPLFLIF